MKRAGVIVAGTLALLFLAGCLNSSGPGNLVPATVDENPGLPRVIITVAGHSRGVHCRTFGNPSAPVLFVIHGSLSDMRAYLPLQILSDRYYVVMWDLRGNGLSERVTRNELTFEAMVEEIRCMKEMFSPDDPVTLLGHSWSAAFLALYLGTWPEDVRQAVLMEPPGLCGEFMNQSGQALNLFTTGYMDMMYKKSYLTALNHELLDFDMLAVLKSSVRDFHCDSASPPPWPVWRPGGFALIVWESAVLDGTEFRYDFTDNLEAFPREVLFVGSSCSPIGYDFQEKTNMTVFSKARILRLENCGHRIITEKLDELVSGLRDYLLEY